MNAKDRYVLGREIMGRHPTCRLPDGALEAMLWPTEAVGILVGITDDELAHLFDLGVLREPRRRYIWKDDLLDLWGVRWPLDDDTQAAYIARCEVVGTQPDPYVLVGLSRKERFLSLS